MHAIAHGGCLDAVRESALETDPGIQDSGDSNPSQYCAWLFSRTLNQLSYSCPYYYRYHCHSWPSDSLYVPLWSCSSGEANWETWDFCTLYSYIYIPIKEEVCATQVSYGTCHSCMQPTPLIDHYVWKSDQCTENENSYIYTLMSNQRHLNTKSVILRSRHTNGLDFKLWSFLHFSLFYLDVSQSMYW